jgi:hypothetical protein
VYTPRIACVAAPPHRRRGCARVPSRAISSVVSPVVRGASNLREFRRKAG